MITWIEENLKLADVIKIMILAASIIWLIAFIRSDIDRNTEWNVRQDAEHEQFLRQDVGDAQFNAIKAQLDRIEQKLED